MKDLSPLEAGRWMEAAPRIVQDVITSQATQKVLEEIAKQRNLHVDVAGLLVKITSYVLLGYASPEDFLRELTAVGIEEKSTREIIAEINQKIFVPLRQQMEKGSMGGVSPVPQPAPMPASQRTDVGVPSYAPPRQSAPLAPPVTAPRPPAPINPTTILPPQGSYAPPPQSPRYPNQENANVNAFVRRVPPSIAPAPRPSISVIAPPPPRQEQSAPPAPTNLPGALPPADIMPPPPKAPIPAAPAQYSTDPYHEPIE